MKRTLRILVAALPLIAFSTALLSCAGNESSASDDDPLPELSMVIDHTCAKIGEIPQAAVEAAKEKLIIAYGHTSHGQQLITGMTGLVDFLGGVYAWNGTGSGGALQLRDKPFPGDLGAATRTAWEGYTRTYLEANPEVNVVIWAWCGQVETATEADIDLYLSLMNGLEHDYPGVYFVYMTGHLNGWTYGTNLFVRNQQIRDYCIDNEKILYDFADIESWDPDGIFYADRRANDNCDYDSDGDGIVDRNWATDWQNAHPGEWYGSPADHTQPLNINLKAYAAWHLWARLAGWDGS